MKRFSAPREGNITALPQGRLLFAADESLFTSQRCWMRVETTGSITRGKTVTDCYSDAQKEANVDLVLDVDRERFAAKVREIMERY